MAATRSLTFSSPRLSSRATASFSQLLAHAWRVVSTRQGLAEMDDRMLQDLGISRAQAQFELAKPVWNIFR
jgi:uncharacterized protein YjiS (DUF1127 family)